MTVVSNQLYLNVIHLTRINLGKVGETLVDQQIRDSLHKDPHELSGSDLKRLICWITAAVSLITDDMDVIDDYTRQLSRMAENDVSRRKLTRA